MIELLQLHPVYIMNTSNKSLKNSLGLSINAMRNIIWILSRRLRSDIDIHGAPNIIGMNLNAKREGLRQKGGQMVG
jgi:hypothetical protein